MHAIYRGYEFNKSEKERHLLNATVREERRQERDTQYKHLSSEIETEVFAKEITGKIEAIVRQQDYSVENAASRH